MSVLTMACAIGCGGRGESETPLRESAERVPRAADDPMTVTCDDCEDPAVLAIDGCDDAVTAVEIDAAGHMALALDQSVHELIACGGMTASLAVALAEGVVELVFEPGDGFLPAGFEAREGGTYHSESRGVLADVDMDIRLFHADSGVATPIDENLFEVETYLVGAHVDASASIDFDITDPFSTRIGVEEPRLAYDEPGPWARLMGLGDPPPNPIRIADMPDFSPDLGSLEAQATVHYQSEREGVLVTYDVVTPHLHLMDLLAGGRVEFEVVALSAERADASMTLALDDDGWDIAYGSGNELDGTVTFTVEGASSTFRGSLEYASSAYGERSVACAR